MSEGRKFNEDESAEILRRAAEMQGQAHSGTDGLSLGDLTKIAEEAGIDPQHVLNAAKEANRPAVATAVAKGAMEEMRRTVPGQLTEEVWEEIVNDLRSMFGRKGKIKKTANRYDWTITKDDGGKLTVSATSKGGQIDLRLLNDTSQSHIAFWVIGSVFTVMAMAMTGKFMSKAHYAFPEIAPTLVVIAAAFVAALVFGARYADRHSRSKHEACLDVVARHLEGLDLSTALPTMTAPASEEETLRLNLQG